MDLQISVRVGDTITHVVCDGNPKNKIKHEKTLDEYLENIRCGGRSLSYEAA